MMNTSTRIFSLALLSAVVLVSARTGFAIVTLPANGLVAHLPGDGNDSDVTGNTNGGNGAYTGPYSTGLFGEAFDISGSDGRDFDIVDPNGVLDLIGGPVGDGGTGAISIGVWVNWQGGDGFLGLIYKHGATRTMAFQTSRAAGGLDFAVVGSGGTHNHRSLVESYNDGQWHSAIAVYADDVPSGEDPDTQILYIDGGANNGGETIEFPNTKEMSHAAEFYNAGSDPPYHVGGYNPPDEGGTWPGLIDEIFFYDRALTEDEVIAIVNQSGPVELPTDFSWNEDGLGDWNNTGSWDPSFGGPPGDPNSIFFSHHTVLFGDAITSDRTIVTDSAVSLSSITFENVNTYAVSGTGSVNLVAHTGGGPPTQIAVNLGNHQFQAIVGLETNTTVDVASGSSLRFNNQLTLNGHTHTKTGEGTLAISNKDVVAGGGTLIGAQGTISGGGTVNGDLDNQGSTVAPGNSPGILSVNGNYTQGGGGTLEIEITGTAAGDGGHDQLNVTGSASLDGTLDIQTDASFPPAVGAMPGMIGDSFVIITAASRTGEFSTVNGRHMGSGTFYKVGYNPTNVSLGAFQAAAGDADGDIDVDITDFNTLAGDFSPTPVAGIIWTDADFDGDEDVDITDFNALAANFAPMGYGGGDGPGQVPEPAGVVLLALGLIIAAYYGLRRR